MKKIRKQLIETERKENQNRKESASYLTQYKKKCEELEIEGKEIEKELKESCEKKIPVIFNSVVDSLKKENLIEDCLHFYKNFVVFSSSDSLSSLSPFFDSFCVHLSRLLQFGNQSLTPLHQNNDNQILDIRFIFLLIIFL